MAETEELVRRELFGGAMEVACPARMVDVSDFRPVPDHQEVLADGSLDQSLVVEVVEPASVPNEEAAVYYFRDLAQANEAAQISLGSVSPLDDTAVPGVPGQLAYKAMAMGTMVAAKGRQGGHAANDVQVLLAVLRMPQYNSDVLITLNTPIRISEHSAATEQAGAGFQRASLSAPPLFEQILQTFKIYDYGVFGSKG
jgi:hypothetical protein